MAVLAALLLAAWLTIAAAPQTPIARLLRHGLIAVPVRLLGRVTRGHVLLAVALLTIVVLVAWLLKGDGVNLLGLMAPEIAAWVTMFEVSTWLDVAVATIAAASVLRLRTLGQIVGARLPRRRSRARRIRRPRPPANDDDGPGLAVAA